MALRRHAPLLVTIYTIALGSGCSRSDRRTVEEIRASFGPDQRAVFDLLVALRGPGRDGDSDWSRAEQLCRSLGWPRCDRPALEQMKVLGRPNPLASAPAIAVANLVWAFGSAEAVKAIASADLARLPESDGPARARAFLRFGIVDTNPDGQAAMFNQACVAEPTICADPATTKRAAEREIRARRVPPGNVLPLYFLGGHTAGGATPPR